MNRAKNNSRWITLALALVLALLARAGRSSGEDSPSQPNIILVYADDLDFDQIGVYDHLRFPSFSGAIERGILKGRAKASPRSRVLTPHIDSLARDGALFSRFYVTSPVCTPSRYSALTGRYASRSKPFCEVYPPGTPATIGWDTYISPVESTVAKSLKALGYRTGHVGKWHLSTKEFFGSPGKRVEGADPGKPGVAEKLKKDYLARTKLLADSFGFDHVGSFYVGNLGSDGVHRSLAQHNMEWVTRGALDFIDESTAGKKPFFLYMAPTLLHGPYNVKHLQGDPKATPAGWIEPPQVQPSRDNIRERVRKAGYDPNTALSTWLDDSIGAILSKLEEKGIADNTLVAFVSDHQSRGKYTIYEAAHVPALIRWPAAIKPGTRVEQLAANIDLAATFIAAAGGKTPADIDGRSLLGALKGGKKPVRDALYLEIAYARAVLRDDWKYIAIRYPEDVLARIRKKGRVEQATWNGRITRNKKDKSKTAIRYNSDLYFPHYGDPDQLYNLREDVYEQKNLASSSSHAKKLAQMKTLLGKLLSPLPHSFGEFKKGKALP